MNDQGGSTVWFWYCCCARGCSLVKTSSDYAGNPAWNSEACPTCGAKITVLDVPGVDQPHTSS